ncbi:choline/ethanolamine kinase-like isoform X2 [Acanthaster planci]|uniref:Choline/ethanolamine kinase-like isoform X2 n=1 Tax=Acanthaster planci TaxID=133434 RepID=A0A8B7XPS1_ACAPL|nr:choline/ethanolamine kinase-like isoform X2 [Acanthaster planci]
MAKVPEDTQVKAYNWCRDYLGGTWRRIKFSDFQIRDLRAGLSNYLYLCSLPSNEKGRKNEPAQVMLRVYGEIFYESDAPLLDTIIFSLLSERQQGPKLYGVFPEGRLEQYIPSRCLTTAELSDPKLSVEIAEKLAKFHLLDLPLCKVPRWLNQVMDKWTKLALTLELESPEDQRLLEEIRSHDLTREVAFVKELIANTKSPVVFCHNDCQEGNILLAKGCPEIKDNSLVLIDYEYASYNYRASDFANHFCEWTIDYTKESAPYFSLVPEDYPSQEQQLRFIRAYLEEYHSVRESTEEEGLRLGAGEGDSSGCNRMSTEAEEKLLLKEITRFTPVIHLLWVMWSCVQAKVSHTAFGYMEYGLARLKEYFRTKAALPDDL